MTGDRKHCKRCGKLDECFAVCPWCLDALERTADARAKEERARVILWLSRPLAEVASRGTSTTAKHAILLDAAAEIMRGDHWKGEP